MATATKRAPARKDADGSVIERIENSLEAADKAAKALRKDVSAGGQDLLKTVEKSIAAARKDSEKLAKAVRADIGDLQKAITSPPARKRAATTTTRARKTPAKRS